MGGFGLYFNLVKRSAWLLSAMLFALALVIVQAPRLKARADSPVGPTKRVIVRYNNVLGSSTEDPAEAENLSGYIDTVKSFQNIPYGVYEVDAQGEASLKSSSSVVSVFENRWYKALADTPITTVGANTSTGEFEDSTTSTVYDGTGYAVAVLDSGVDKNHDLFAGKVIHEACFGENAVYSNATVTDFCPSASTAPVVSQHGNNTGLNCDLAYGTCYHGTHVAGSVASPVFGADLDGDSVDEIMGGTAQGAKIIAIQIFQEITVTGLPNLCGGQASCVMSSDVNILGAIDYLLGLDVGMPIAAANMSFGVSGAANSYAECQADNGAAAYAEYFNAFRQLRNAGIAPVVANGNDGHLAQYKNGLGFPACVEGAIAVGSTSVPGDVIAAYSNNGALTTILAPGGNDDGVNDETTVWQPAAGTASDLIGMQGTSMAAPVVSGAIATLRDKHPNATINQLVALLQETGTNVVDNRPDYTVGGKKLLNLANALSHVSLPVINDFEGPVGTVHENAPTELTVDVDGATSCSLNGGIGTVNVSSGTVTVPGRASYELTCVNSMNDEVTDTLTAGSFNSGPTKPGALGLETNVAGRSATISWAASTDSDGIEHYVVQLDGVTVAQTTSTSFTFTDLSLDHNYTASVYAVDSLGAFSAATSQGVVLGATSTPGVPNTGLLNIFHGLYATVALALLAAGSSIALLVFGRKLVFAKRSIR